MGYGDKHCVNQFSNSLDNGLALDRFPSGSNVDRLPALRILSALPDAAFYTVGLFAGNGAAVRPGSVRSVARKRPALASGPGRLSTHCNK